MSLRIDKHNNTCNISTGYKDVRIGTRFATSIKWIFDSLFGIILSLIILQSCVMPADIRTRPDEGDEDWWPKIINPQPPTSKDVIINPSCTEYSYFRFLIAIELSDDDEYRQEHFETRWFINNEWFSSEVGYHNDIDLSFNLIASECKIEEMTAETFCKVEAYVSDIGFKDEDGNQPAEDAHYDSIIWLIFVDTTIPCE